MRPKYVIKENMVKKFVDVKLSSVRKVNMDTREKIKQAMMECFVDFKLPQEKIDNFATALDNIFKDEYGDGIPTEQFKHVLKEGHVLPDDYKDNPIKDRIIIRNYYNVLNDMLDAKRLISFDIWEKFISRSDLSEKLFDKLLFLSRNELNSTTKKIINMINQIDIKRYRTDNNIITYYKKYFSDEQLKEIVDFCEKRIEEIEVPEGKKCYIEKMEGKISPEEQDKQEEQQSLWQLKMSYSHIANDLIAYSGVLIYKRLGIDDDNPVQYIKKNNMSEFLEGISEKKENNKNK